MQPVKPHLEALLELHRASEALQKSRDALDRAGHATVAALVDRAGHLVAYCVGKLVVAESKKREASQ